MISAPAICTVICEMLFIGIPSDPTRNPSNRSIYYANPNTQFLILEWAASEFKFCSHSFTESTGSITVRHLSDHQVLLDDVMWFS